MPFRSTVFEVRLPGSGSSPVTLRRGIAVFAVAAVLPFAGATGALASQLLVPAIGAPDSAMNGATVGTPMTPAAAAYSNPAGIMHLAPGSTSFSIGVPVGHSAVRATAPPGYRSDSDFVAFAPEGGAVFETENGLRWGFALYGSLGAVFDSDADPSVGVDHDFLSEQGISNASFMVAWNAGEKLSFGFALTAVYAETHLRYFQNIPWAYTTRGPGIQAIGGLRYQLTDAVALGLGVRSPGMVWARGDHRMPSGEKQDVDLDLNLPSQVFAGVNVDLTDRLDVGLYGRWTDASTFGGSEYEFEQTPAGNIPFIRSATDEWRIGTGARYRVTEGFAVSTGVGYADSIVPDTWVTPLLMDSDEWKLSAGISYLIRGWTVDFSVGHSFTGDRRVSPAEAAVFPGKYSMSGQIYILGFRKEL